MSKTMVSERRRHKRISLFSELECSYAGGMDKRPKRLLDISSGGMFIDCMLPPAIGTIVDIKFNLQGYDKPIHAKAQVMFRQEGVGMGVQFTEIDREVLASIEALIAHIEKTG